MRTCLERASNQQTAHGLTAENTQQRREGNRARPAVHLGAYLCGLTLLLELLQLLGSEETHRLVAGNELSARRHGGEDDVSAQPTEAADGGKTGVTSRPEPGHVLREGNKGGLVPSGNPSIVD